MLENLKLLNSFLPLYIKLNINLLVKGFNNFKPKYAFKFIKFTHKLMS